MRSIGEMARDSGLRVSALRFYDRAGVLVPAWVDPVSGYRWYGPEQCEEARLLTRLRRAGMPLPDIRLVLAGWSGADTDLVRKLLQAHLRRLERGLSDARNEFSAVRALLERRENPMTSLRTTTPTAAVRLAVSAAELAAALDAVRFAVSTDPELPMLGGVLFDIEGEALHVVATDRYRMAVARTGAAGHDGPRAQVIVPVPLADAMRALLSGEGSVQLSVADSRVDGGLVGGSPADGSPVDGDPVDGSPVDGSPVDGSPVDGSPVDGSPVDGSPVDGSPVDGGPVDGGPVGGGRLTLEVGDRQVGGQCLDHAFPDYRRLVRLPAGHRAVVDVRAFREALETGPVSVSETLGPDGVPCDLSLLKPTPDGTVIVCADDEGDEDDQPGKESEGGRDRVAVNREFLLHALAAGGRDRLVLEFGAPTAPLVIRRPDTEDAFSMLMPVRLEN
ncbi:MerR family transcriptional regulator [Streptomyces sp. NBC_00878]|uniref:DNA polymerase III subunit beta family protein n=1 Tax=Streptomyces sp. NBC_00878 TaxID=2975854 RepID=UPI002B1DA719|nr:MerR family transcriptional regulator [Streptomyces sp. NBC_00878]